MRLWPLFLQLAPGVDVDGNVAEVYLIMGKGM